jgi:hypothetical protein
MSAEPGAPAEEPKETDPVTHQALEERLELFERGLKNRMDPIIKEVAQRIAESAIREFKMELETAQRDQERKESSRKTARDLEWIIRIVSCLVVAMLTLVFSAVVSQCTGNIADMRERLSTLESKEAKK